MGAMGGSQGGALTIACAALVPEISASRRCIRFSRTTSACGSWISPSRPYEEIRTYFRRYDPLHAREREIFTKLGYIDIQHLAGRIRGETLMGITLMDTICPPSTQFAVFNTKSPRRRRP